MRAQTVQLEAITWRKTISSTFFELTMIEIYFWILRFILEVHKRNENAYPPSRHWRGEWRSDSFP